MRSTGLDNSIGTKREFRIHPEEIRRWAILEWNGPDRCKAMSEADCQCESEAGHFGAHEFSTYDYQEGAR